MKKAKYYVVGMQTIGREDVGNYMRKYVSNPESAIRTWFRYGIKAPMETSIRCVSKEDALELVKWADANQDLICQFYSRFGCVYKLSFLLDSITKKVADSCKYFYESKEAVTEQNSALGDEIYPFSQG